MNSCPEVALESCRCLDKNCSRSNQLLTVLFVSLCKSNCIGSYKSNRTLFTAKLFWIESLHKKTEWGPLRPVFLAIFLKSVVSQSYVKNANALNFLAIFSRTPIQADNWTYEATKLRQFDVSLTHVFGSDRFSSIAKHTDVHPQAKLLTSCRLW